MTMEILLDIVRICGCILLGVLLRMAWNRRASK